MLVPKLFLCALIVLGCLLLVAFFALVVFWLIYKAFEATGFDPSVFSSERVE